MIRGLETKIKTADDATEEVRTIKQQKEIATHRPHLILCPPNLITQWQDEISMLCGAKTFKFVSYYGDWRGSKNDHTKPTSKYLENDDAIFDESEQSGKTIVFSSYDTWMQRHGPQASRAYRKKIGISDKTIANTPGHLPIGWERNLEGKFATVTLDEAHKIKNEDTATSISIQWLKPQFYIMTSATPCSNRGTDFSGFAKLIDPGIKYWKELFEEDPNRLNPFDESLDSLDSDDPRRDFVVSYDKFKKYVNPKDLDESVRGKRLRRIWSRCVLRRTYGSKVRGVKIGDKLPRCQMLRVTPKFTPAEKIYYNQQAAPHRKNLVCKTADGKRLIYRRDKYRKLVLLSTWTGFADERLEKLIRSKTLSQWAEEGDGIIWEWYNAAHPEKPVKKDDVQTLLQWVLTGAPKLRALLAILDNTLVTNKQKELIWTTFPAQQLLLFGTLRLLKIDAQLFHAGLSMSERKKLVRQFTTNRKGCMALVGNFFLNCCGLNLHYLCFRTSFFDVAPSEPMRQQAVGRVRRFGQQHTVQVIDYSNPGSFDLEQLNANSNKVVPQLIATLSIYRDTKLRPDDLEEELSLGQWVKVGNKLMSVEQARDNGVQYSDENLLNEDQLIVALNKALAGQEVELSNVPGFAVQYGLEDDDEEKEEDSGEERSPSNSGLMGQSNLLPLSDDEFERSAERRTSSEWRAILEAEDAGEQESPSDGSEAEDESQAVIAAKEARKPKGARKTKKRLFKAKAGGKDTPTDGSDTGSQASDSSEAGIHSDTTSDDSDNDFSPGGGGHAGPGAGNNDDDEGSKRDQSDWDLKTGTNAKWTSPDGKLTGKHFARPFAAIGLAGAQERSRPFLPTPTPGSRYPQITLAELKAQKDAAREKARSNGILQLHHVKGPSTEEIKRLCQERNEAEKTQRQARRRRRRKPKCIPRMEGDDSKVKIDNLTPSIPVRGASSMYDVPSASGSTSGPSTALTQESRLPNHRSDAGNTLLVYGDEVDWSDGPMEERELKTL